MKTGWLSFGAFVALGCGDSADDPGNSSPQDGTGGTALAASGGTGGHAAPEGGTGGDPPPGGSTGGNQAPAPSSGGVEVSGTGGCAGGSQECNGECVGTFDPDYCLGCNPCPEDPNGLGTRVCLSPPQCSFDGPDGSLLCGDACVTCGGLGNPCFLELWEVRVSDCGGFNPGLTTYCDAERLEWRYSTNSTSLNLEHWRFLTACAADIEVSLQRQEGIYHLVETDVARAPEDCLCARDVEFHFNVPATELTLDVGGRLFELQSSPFGGS